MVLTLSKDIISPKSDIKLWSRSRIPIFPYPKLTVIGKPLTLFFLTKIMGLIIIITNNPFLGPQEFLLKSEDKRIAGMQKKLHEKGMSPSHKYINIIWNTFIFIWLRKTSNFYKKCRISDLFYINFRICKNKVSM